jgi:hypothetical protein
LTLKSLFGFVFLTVFGCVSEMYLTWKNIKLMFFQTCLEFFKLNLIQKF